MNKRTINVPVSAYNDLVRKAERIEVVKRMISNDRYIGLEDVKIILGIKEREESEDEAV